MVDFQQTKKEKDLIVDVQQNSCRGLLFLLGPRLTLPYLFVNPALVTGAQI